MTLLDIFTSKDKWTKGFYARDKYGQKCFEGSTDATCYCILGAIKKVYYGLPVEVDNKLETALKKLHPNSSGNYVHFNDDPKTTFEDIIELIKEAGV